MGNTSTVTCSFTVTVNDNEKPGITCADDVTINTTTGLCTGTTTLTNPTVTDNCPLSLAGNALNFDGTNDYVTIPNESNFDFTNTMTVEVWTKLNPSSTSFLTLISKGDDSWRLHCFPNQNKIQFGTSGLSNTGLSSTTSVSEGNWHHIAAVFTGTQKLIYIDGNLDASTSVTGTIGNSAYQVAFGENLQLTGRYYNGSLDEVRIWSTARTQAQIQANMNLELSTGPHRLAVGAMLAQPLPRRIDG
ncbi:MAG: LamG domain-containing protein [Saprospiraceae bacterium]